MYKIFTWPNYSFSRAYVVSLGDQYTRISGVLIHPLTSQTESQIAFGNFGKLGETRGNLEKLGEFWGNIGKLLET